jgi:putative FmdB family regulatory protein
MSARAFRCRECGYPFKIAEQGWARDVALMCPACGSADVSILLSSPRWSGVTMTAAEQGAETIADATAEQSTGTEERRSR